MEIQELQDLSVQIDLEEFSLLKNQVDLGQLGSSFELLVGDIVVSYENLSEFVVEQRDHEEVLVKLYYELIVAYNDELFLNQDQIADLVALLFELEEFKETRIADFLILCNSFPVPTVKPLIQRLKLPQQLLLENLGTLLLLKLGLFSTAEYRASLEKNAYKYENYQLNFEDTIGYSMLVVQLYTAFADKFARFKVDYYTQVCTKLIAFYQLDPYRVFDIIFDVMASNLIRNYQFLVLFLKASIFWPTSEHKTDLNNLFGNLNEGGNEKAMQIILMKLHYQDLKTLSETHKILIGMLIKIGFINLGHLFNFLRPFNDADMVKIETAYNEKLKQQEISDFELAMAPPLMDSDDEDSSSTKKKLDTTKSTTTIDPKLNIKIAVLKACLSVGLYNESIFIISQYPYLIRCDENLAFLLNRFMELMIDDWYYAKCPLPTNQLQELAKARKVAQSRGGSQSGKIVFKDFPVTHLLTFDALTQSYSAKKFHFFYPWKEDIPKANNIDDLFKISNEFLSLIGARIVDSPSLFEKLCHIVSRLEDREKALDYYRKFIFPYIPFIENNLTLVQKLFEILKDYDLQTRYNIYGEFYQSMYIRSQTEIQLRYKKAEKETGRSLKRLTLQSAKTICRKLSKISMSSPMPVLIKILENLESYDNLIDLIVDHLAPLFNEFTWDVLPMAILIRLTKPGRSLVQEDGLNERQWLQSLSAFIGKISRNALMNLQPILIYSLKKLNNGEINESIVLKDLLGIMTGIKPITNLTLEQIELLSSENSLRHIALNVIQDGRFKSVKPAVRILEELIKTDSLNEFFILLCSLTSSYITNTETAHLKILTQKHDDFESILHLFADLFNEFLKYPDFIKNVLPVDQLCSTYKVKPQWGFEIWRKRLSQMIDKNITQNEDCWNPVLKQVMGPIQKSLDTYNWQTFEIGYYVSFWQLSLYDINFSANFYDTRLTDLSSTIKLLQMKLKVSSKDRDVPSTELKRIKDEISINSEIVKSIPLDKIKHENHYESVMTRLNQEKDFWIKEDVDLTLQIENFLDYCLLPRSVHSPFDAIFCAKFVFFWHKINEKFPKITSIILEYLMNKDIINSLLLTFTATQLENFGLFYGEILSQLNEWRSEEKFNELAIGEGIVGMEGIDYTTYRQTLFVIHEKIVENLRWSLKDQSYMTRSNCLIFLKNLLDIFPLVDVHCEAILKSIELILLEDDREDLKLSSNSLIGRIRSYSSKWVPLSEFYDMTEEQLAAYNEGRELVKRKLLILESKRRAAIALQEEEARKQALLKAAELAKAKEAAEGNPYTKLRSHPHEAKPSTKSTENSTAAKSNEADSTVKPSEASTVTKASEVSTSARAAESGKEPVRPQGPRATQSKIAQSDPKESKSSPAESKNDDKTPTPQGTKRSSPDVAESSKPQTAEDRSKLLKARIEAEKLKSNNQNRNNNPQRSSRGQDLVSTQLRNASSQSRNSDRNASSQPRNSDRNAPSQPRNADRNSSTQPRNSDRNSDRSYPPRNDRRPPMGPSGTNDRKRRQQDDYNYQEKKQRTATATNTNRNGNDAPPPPPPLPPPSDPAPPSGPSNRDNGFDPKRRTRLPPVNSRSGSSKYDDSYNRRQQYRGSRQ